jgi:hypothetical protein
MYQCRCHKNYQCLLHCGCHLHYTCLFHRPDYNCGYPGMELDQLMERESRNLAEIQQILTDKYQLYISKQKL